VRQGGPSDNTENGLAASARMTISRAGFVGIGESAPFTALDVRGGSLLGGPEKGEIHVGSLESNSDPKVVTFGDLGCFDIGCVYIGEVGADNRMVLRAGDFRFRAGNVAPESDGFQSLGTFSNRWSAVWAVNGTIQTSDARLKKDVVDLRYGLQEVMQLRPVHYEWKDRPDRRQHLGLIAQEVQRVVPEAVFAGQDASATLGMSYTDLVPVVIKAIQELATENATLRTRISALERPPAK
jgi:hypothetical protein